MRYRHWLWTLAGLPLGLLGSPVSAAEPKVQTPEAIFRSLQTADAEMARQQALAWLEKSGKLDQARFNALWSKDLGVLERVARTFAMGDAEAARLLKEAADPKAPAPTEVPALFGDQSKPAFFRANLGLAYARSLAQRRVHEEALALLVQIKPDQVVDPATYFFYRAVAEHALNHKAQAQQTIRTMKEDVVDAPDRYQRVAELMMHDMDTWNAPTKGREEYLRQRLGNVARDMSNVERRLDLSRAGKGTQDLQRRVVAQLDELIKELEPPDPKDPPDDPKDPKDPNDPSEPGPPKPGPPGPPKPGPGGPGGPAPDDVIGGPNGPGMVNDVALRKLMEQWGKLPEHERAKAKAALLRSTPPRWAAVIEKHFRDLARGER